jgi:uncharacterized protein YukE
MNEFEEKDYAGARSCADSIKNNADNIMNIFNDIDGIMNSLYGSNWESSGAENARERYNEIRKNYEVFYEKVIAMKNHIYNVTAANEDADSAASQNIASI